MKIHAEGLALAEDLLISVRKANRLDGYFAQQAGGAYGVIHDAVVTTLTAAIATARPMFWEDARRIAKRLLDEALDNGENLAYQIDLFDRGVIL
jgi:hypothetical protein